MLRLLRDLEEKIMGKQERFEESDYEAMTQIWIVKRVSKYWLSLCEAVGTRYTPKGRRRAGLDENRRMGQSNRPFPQKVEKFG